MLELMFFMIISTIIMTTIIIYVKLLSFLLLFFIYSYYIGLLLSALEVVTKNAFILDNIRFNTNVSIQKICFASRIF